MHLTIQHGGRTHDVDLPPDATADDLRAALTTPTGVLARSMKLIHKGKALPPPGGGRATPAAALAGPPTLSSLGVGDGAKLMLLASTGAGTAGAAALAAARSATAARQRERAAANPPPPPPPSSAADSSSWPSRAAVWAKTGVVALRDAGISSLPDVVWGEAAAAATALDAGGNPALTALPPRISEFTRLTRLRLSHTGIASVPPALASLARLETLLLDRCALTASPVAVLAGLTSLKSLSLAHNRGLVSLTGGGQVEGGGPGPPLGADPAPAAAWPPALEILDVSHCALTSLPPGLGPACPRLALLDARANRIGPTLPADLAAGGLATLRLDGNLVAALPPGLLDGPGVQLSSLTLHHNPITAEALRGTPGFAAYDARRVAAANKQIAGRTVVTGGGGAFDEGADAIEWMPYGPQH